MKTTQIALNATADRVEAVLRNHRAPAHVVGGKLECAQLEFHLALEPGTRINQVRALLGDLRLAVGEPGLTLVQHGERLLLRFGARAAPAIQLGEVLAQRPSTHAPLLALGVDADGAPLFANLASPRTPHVLIAGATGSGKTVLAQSAVLSLCRTLRPAQLGLLVLDPKRRPASHPFASEISRHLLRPVAHDVPAALEALHHAERLMEQRLAGVTGSARVLVWVDEAADFCMRGGHLFRSALTRLAMRGREHGVHVLVCTQKPSSDVLGADLKANLPLRLLGRMSSADDARSAAGRSGSGAELLRRSGEFVAVQNDLLVRFRAPVWDVGGMRAGGE